MSYIHFVAILFSICVFSCEAKNTNESLNYKIYNRPEKTSSDIHVITVDPSTVKIISARAQNMGQGLATVTSLGKHFKALAAINGGFFRFNGSAPSNGLPAGVLKINNIWHGINYKERAAIGWQPQTKIALIDIVQTDSKVYVNNQALPINAINKIVRGNRAALLSDSYTDKVVSDQSLNLIIVDKNVLQITNNAYVPNNGYIYCLNGSLRNLDVKPGDNATVKIKILPQLKNKDSSEWQKLPFIVGGSPVLISNGRKMQDFSREHLDLDFINRRNGRTAIGIMPDKKWVLVVVERVLLDEKSGIALRDLRDFMHKELGCIDAINLDGGGSSSLYIQGRKESAIDQPISDAVLILRKD